MPIMKRLGITPRELMELSIREMNKSIQEKRDDGKTSPKVGVVLIKPNGDIVTAYRGELREGDHAEFTLLERKCIGDNLLGATVYSTLEPCFHRNSPKVGCCKRLVKARIAKVYVGISDPDPTVDGKGIDYLMAHGVEVEMYDIDLQKQIEEANKDFISEALIRNKAAKLPVENEERNELETGLPHVEMNALDEKLLKRFLVKQGFDGSMASLEVQSYLLHLSMIQMLGDEIHPTGIGLLLFGKKPQPVFPSAVIKAMHKKGDVESDIITIDGPLVLQPQKISEWYKEKIPSHIDRSSPVRSIVYEYPLEVIRELVVNAIVHRDYKIKGAPIFFEINDDAIIIKSPGMPEPPLKLEQIKSFNAPSLSRNPKIMFVLDKFGLVEQRGLGFTTIRKLPREGYPLPIVEYQEPYIVITLPLRYSSAIANTEESLSEDEMKCIEFIRLKGSIARADYQEFAQLETKKAERTLKRLVQKGLIESTGSKRGTRYIVKDKNEF